MRAGLPIVDGLSWLLASGGIAVAFTVSANLLTDVGSAYVTEGGTLPEKIHPASYLMILAGAVRLGGDIVSRTASSRATVRQRGLVIYVGGIVFCALFCVLFSGTGGVIALLDTYLPAGGAALALSCATRQQRQWLGVLIVLLCTANAALAAAEAAWQVNIVPLGADVFDPGAEFRPTALYDHPLTGAAATVLGLLLTTSLAWPAFIIMPCQAILLVGLVCFGERAPLLIGLGTLFGVALATAAQRIIHRKPCTRRLAILAWTACAVTCAIALVCCGGLSERLTAHAYWDESAQVRINQFRILAWLTPSQLIFGCPRDDLIALLEPLRLTYHVGVIENFWLVMAATLGLLCFPVFVFSLWKLLAWLWRAGDGAGRLMVVVLIATASTSNSLGRKSALLIMLVACVMATGVPGSVRLHTGMRAGHRRSLA